MTLPFNVDLVPLRLDEGGAVRVGNTRITLDLLVDQYENGMSPEDMVRAYDALELADAHAVIAYYLRNRDEVKRYLQLRGLEAASLRSKVESNHPPLVRQDLITRHIDSETANAPAGE